MINRVLIAGGGTGGHLFPGLAVAEELRRRNRNVSASFVGTARGIESRILPGLGERLHLIDVAPLKGRDLQTAMASLARVPQALKQARAVLTQERPDLVIGVGGYASGPVLMAASLMRIPTAIMEQNASVGLTNRLLAPLVGRAYVAFEETARTLGAAKSRIVGNPVRRVFVDQARVAAFDPDAYAARRKTILVLGGSQGSKALNERLPEVLGPIAQAAGLEIVHQTGAAMQLEVSERYKALGVTARVVSFIDNVVAAYAQAAVVVCRAGATTVAELCVMGRPSLLIPFAGAADDHQTQNARALVEGGAGVLVPESEASHTRLEAELSRLIANPAMREDMGERARRLGRPDAAAAVVDDLAAWLGFGDADSSRLDNEEAPATTPPTTEASSSEPEPRRRQSLPRRRWVSPLDENLVFPQSQVA